MSYKINVKPFRQSPDFCGPGALIIAASAFGKVLNEEELAKLCGTTTEAEKGFRMGGTEHEGVIKAAETLGFHVFSKEEGTIKELEYFVNEEHLPVIVGWFDRDDDHYSVVVEVAETEIVMADSSSEGPERTVSKSLFPRIWFDFVGEGNHKVSWGWYMVLTTQKRSFKV
jgi:ABC-type bacteriocin/lantibiotic exporter with double-glycine peptidase domain